MRIHPRFALLALASLSLLAPDLDAQRRRGRYEEPELQNIRFEERSFESAALGDDEVTYGVFLPSDYDAEENEEQGYPLLIWLHGINENHRSFFVKGGGAILDRMIGDGSFPKAIVICPNGGRSFWTNAVGEDRGYEDLVSVDLVAHAEATYRLDDANGKRAIGGVSMGGLGALKIGFKHPDTFGVMFGHAAAVLPDNVEELQERFPWIGRGRRGLLTGLYGDPVDEDRYRQDNLLVLANELDEEIAKQMRIYFDAGTDDRYGFGQTNAQLSAVLEEREIEHQWTLVEDGGHSWGSGFTQARLPISLAFVARQWTTRRALEGLGGALGGSGEDGLEESGGEKPQSGGGDGR
ncbi:MAG: alpha/beta hydrolase-fold protein [Planctomycetota bacterium]